MREIASWLITIEKGAHQIYIQASELLRDKDELVRLLSVLADDEAFHYHVMNSVMNHLSKDDDYYHPFYLDENLKEKIERPFKKVSQLIADHRLTERGILECLVDSETSEWNDIFIYTINVLKQRYPEFKYCIPKIQQHLGRIENFFHQHREYTDILNNVKALPKLWTEKILIVEDFEPLQNLLSDLLGGYGEVDVAGNGLVALQKARNQYYSAIISDIQMPEMDGMTFYQNLKKEYPEVGERFIFISSNFSKSHLHTMKQDGLRFKEKPVKISELRQMVFGVLGIDYN